jgi:hypothetical protein
MMRGSIPIRMNICVQRMYLSIHMAVLCARRNNTGNSTKSETVGIHLFLIASSLSSVCIVTASLTLILFRIAYLSYGWLLFPGASVTQTVM